MSVDWSHQPLSLTFSSCPKNARAYCANYEWARQCPDLINLVQKIRETEEKVPLLWNNPVSRYWPDNPFLAIPEDILADQIAIWRRHILPESLCPRYTYLDDSVRVEFQLPTPSELPTSPNPSDVIKYLSRLYRQKQSRDIDIRYADQLQLLAI
jgi:hypothetical protein